MKYFITVAATIVAAQDARVRTTFVETPYDIKLNCGDCIASGFNYAWKSRETGLVVNDQEYPVNTGRYDSTDVMCCEGSTAYYADYNFPGTKVNG
jgi:hypothetical protein